MTITLITPEIHEELRTIAEEHPELVFQNVGYEYLRPAVKEAKAEQIARISDILREHVWGFSEFFNFRMSGKDKDVLELRFNYVWERHLQFVGVGYLPVDWLRDGFPDRIEHETITEKGVG